MKVPRASRGGLSRAQLSHFLRKGYVILRDCLDPKTAREWVAGACRTIGYDPKGPRTRRTGLVQAPATMSLEVRTLSPKAWSAICALVGGESRISDPGTHTWSNSFIINFPSGPESRGDKGGWHKDGDSPVHYLDSQELGLLAFVFWSDIGPHGGGTQIACDSIKHVARYLLERPRGAPLTELRNDFWSLACLCRDFVELTGKAGDVVLLHPFMLHRSSVNASRRPRFMTNRLVPLSAPLRFNRPRKEDFSPVELAVVNALGPRASAGWARAPGHGHKKVM